MTAGQYQVIDSHPIFHGRVISLLQDCRLVQSRAHHGRHHGGDRNTHFCTVTPWLNPVRAARSVPPAPAISGHGSAPG